MITFALALFGAETFFTSHGALTVGGITCLILGGTMLVDSPSGSLRVSLSALIPLAVTTGLTIVFLLRRVISAQQSRVQTGGEALVDEHAVGQDAFRAD